MIVRTTHTTPAIQLIIPKMTTMKGGPYRYAMGFTKGFGIKIALRIPSMIITATKKHPITKDCQACVRTVLLSFSETNTIIALRIAST